MTERRSKNIDLETYRQMFMYNVNFDENVVRMMFDFARFRKPDEKKDDDSDDDSDN